MNLADAIRQAKSQPGVITEGVVPMVTRMEEAPVVAMEAAEQEIFMNDNNGQHSGGYIRVELFLTPDQLSTLFKVVASQQHSMLTLKEAASFLRLPMASIENLAHDGQLPAFLVDGKWRFSKQALEDWTHSNQKREAS